MKDSMLEQVGEDGRRKVIQEVLTEGKVFAERMIRVRDISELMRTNMELYETFFKKGYVSGVLFCQIAHVVYLREAKRRGIDHSEFGEFYDEWCLDYMEKRN